MFMSLDRYLALVRPLSSKAFCSKCNAYIVIGLSLICIMAFNIPLPLDFNERKYPYFKKEISVCLYANDSGQNEKTLVVPLHSVT